MPLQENKKRRNDSARSNLRSDARGKIKPVTDPRFANIQSDPRYRLPSKKNKVKLDSRFSRALHDDDFNRRARVDRYGRPLDTHTERQRLKRKYEFEDEEGANSSQEDDDNGDDGDDNESNDDKSEEDKQDKRVRKELRRAENKQPRDILRQGLNSDSSSSDSSTDSDSESSTDDDDDDEAEDVYVENEAELAPQTTSKVPEGEVTHRLAVVNLDWDNIRAQDLMAVFSSPGFLPPNGRLLKVAIYPSEFGKERMAREEMEGPPAEIFAKAKKSQDDDSSDGNDDDDDANDDEDEDDDEAIKRSILAPEDGTTDFDSTALRAYQLERLRYYYAILTFSSTAVAKHIYDTVDGTEYLSTANFFDLRFVPDDTSFDDDTPREECESLESGYKPNEFVTDALQHSKVKLTWDAEDAGRKEAKERAFGGGRKDIDENDLKAYLGTDSSAGSEDEDEDDEGRAASPGATSKKEVERQRLRTLLGLPAEPVAKPKTKNDPNAAPVGGIQVTFSAGLSSNVDGDKKRSVFENSPEPEETTVEKYVRKERERKQKRRERIKANREGGLLPDEKNHDQDANIAKVGVQEQGDKEDEDLGFDDPFFLNESGSKSTATVSTNKQRKEERLKKKKEREEAEERDRKERAELELLMKDDDGDDDDGSQGDNLSASAGSKKTQTIRHFDMREIERAEKQQRKEEKRKAAKKKVKGKKAGDDILGSSSADGFKIDTADPRFAALFENHEYAIDPTNPKYKGTKGMEQLLEEGRQRKKRKE